MQLSDAIGDYARSTNRDCDIDTTHAFISDKTTPQTRLFHLGNYGVDEEILHHYLDHRICDSDPFLDVQMNERDAAEGDPAFRLANQPEVQRCGARARDYWRFVSHKDIEVVGASTLRLQSRLYLVIGAHRTQRRRGRAAVPAERLAHRIETLQNKIANSLLSSMLVGGGYRSLLSAIAPSSAPGAPELSARETEVARLVCDGRQNKEIAWLAGLSEYTVENHLRRIYRKLGIHNRAALVARMNRLVA